ncbi:3-deoxy-D-arabinoheptulosonate-7-phosphate synthase [Nonomuraea longispora]|uniref:3-deoxy-D-arabinoheptulosonate-7-phosphate synthase n=1 Tax=Nonomuraea longispora TaxID=1848320 RepID=A0A4R4MVX9_9ACTN|nr:3-deoxy-D-arabinoheptulosonate-7-phosphate synthase [Nonomuraea longispora]
MSSTLERHAVAVGGLLVGEGPAVVIGGRVSLREHNGRADAYEVLRERAGRAAPLLVEPSSAADLPAIAALAGAVVVGSTWTRDIPLVRAAAGLGLPVVVERRASGTLEEWLGLAGYCAAEGDGQVILCEGGSLDLGVMRAARVASGRPVLADVSRNVGLSAAAVAAGADGLLLPAPVPAASVNAARTPSASGASGSGNGGTGSAGHGGASGNGAVGSGRVGTGEPPQARRAGYAGVVAREFAAAGGIGLPGAMAEPGAILQAGPEAALQVAEEAVTVVGALLRPESPATLPECREAIDRVDAALATLLERRAALAGIVQRIKPVGGFAGRDLDREHALVKRMASRAPSLGEARLAPIMNAVIEAGLHLAEERAHR